MSVFVGTAEAQHVYVVCERETTYALWLFHPVFLLFLINIASLPLITPPGDFWTAVGILFLHPVASSTQTTVERAVNKRQDFL